MSSPHGTAGRRPSPGSQGRSPCFGIADGAGHITYLLTPHIESE